MEKLKTLFASDRAFWAGFTIFAGVVAVLKGIRQPSLVAATQAQLNYDFGLIRRGLFGTVAQALDIPVHHYEVFALVSYLLLAIYGLVLVHAVRKSALPSTLSGLMICAVFASSYTTTYTAHLVGRLDIPLMTATLLIATTRDPLLRNAILIVVAPLCVLLHEMFFLAFLPVCLLPTVFDLLLKPRTTRVFVGAGAALIALGVSAATTVLLALQHFTATERIAALRSEIESRVDFPLDRTVWGILERGAAENVGVMTDWGWHIGTRILSVPFSLILFLPTTAFLLVCVWRILKADFFPQRAALTMAVLSLCVASPLALNLFGADMDRWNAFILFNSFVALLVVARPGFAPGATLPMATTAWSNLAILLVATNLAAGGGLLDFAQITPWPFREHGFSLLDLAREGSLPRPTR